VHGLTYSDVGADVAGAAASAVSSHAALITGVHGLVFTAGKTLTLTESLTFNALPIGGLAVATGANVLGSLAVGTVGQYIAGAGAGTVPSWATLNQAAVAGLTTGDSPTLAGLTLTADLTVPNGGTGVSTLADGGLMIGNATGAVEVVAAGTALQILVGGGALTAPVWGTDLPTAVTIGSAYIYRAAGTDVPVTDGGTGASTLALNGVLYGNTTAAVGVTAIGAQYQVLTVGANPFVPAWSGYLISGTTGGKTTFAVTNLKTLTITSTDDYNLTVAATSSISGTNTGDNAANSLYDIGSDTQAYSARLAEIAALAVTDSNIIVGNGASWVAETGATARTSLGLAIGVDVQEYNATLASVAAGTYSGDDSIVTVGTVTAGGWHGTEIAADHGGTGQTVYAVGDLLYASTTTAISKLADVAVGSYLRSGGIGVAPLWSTLTLPNAGTAFRLPVYSATNVMTELAASGATGEYLKGNTGAIPSWATLNQAAVAGLTTGDSPAFVTVKLSGLTDGYIPYHVSDAAGLANSPISTDGTKTLQININTAQVNFGADGYNSIYRWDGATKGTTGNCLRIDSYDNISFGTSQSGGQQGAVMTLLSANGNVGIGAVSPGFRLDVQAVTAQLNLQSTTGTNKAYSLTQNTGGILYAGEESSVGGGILSGSLAYAGIISKYSATAAYNVLQFGTNDTVRMTIANGGNVGIGTVAPGDLLHLHKTASGVIGPTIRLSNLASTYSDGSAIDFYGGGAAPGTLRARMKMSVDTGGAGNGEFTFSVGDTTLTDVLHISGGGNVGIGMSPTYTLDITGNLRCSTGFGCNSKTPQTAYASGGDITPGAGAFGADSAVNFAAMVTLVKNMRAALVANGIMS
jgi:hypothetical protein